MKEEFLEMLKKQIGVRVKHYRKESGKTQIEVVDEIRQSHLSALENGRDAIRRRDGKVIEIGFITKKMYEKLENNLPIEREFLVFGTEEEIEENVKWLYDRMCCNIKWKWNIDNKKATCIDEGDNLAVLDERYIETNKKMYELFSMNAELLYKKYIITDPTFAYLNEGEKEKKLNEMNSLYNNFCNQIWEKEKKRFISAFKMEFIEKNKVNNIFVFDFKKASRRGHIWINNVFSPVFEDLQEEYDDNPIFELGYRAKDIINDLEVFIVGPLFDKRYNGINKIGLIRSYNKVLKELVAVQSSVINDFFNAESRMSRMDDER